MVLMPPKTAHLMSVLLEVTRLRPLWDGVRNCQQPFQQIVFGQVNIHM